MKKLIFLLIILSQFAFGESKGEMIVKKIDEYLSLESDGTAKVTITTQKKGQGIKQQEMIYYRQDSTDSFLIVMVAPENEKGNGYLKQGDNMWVYRKNTRTFQHINSDESIGGSDATADDFEMKKLSEEYSVAMENGKEKIEELTLGGIEVYKIELVARTDNVKDPKRIYWVSKDNYLPLRIQNFSLSGTLMDTITFKKYKKIDGSYIATSQLIVDEFDVGNKSLVNLTDISTEEIPAHIFTKAYLENLSK